MEKPFYQEERNNQNFSIVLSDPELVFFPTWGGISVSKMHISSLECQEDSGFRAGWAKESIPDKKDTHKVSTRPLRGYSTFIFLKLTE